MATKHGTTDTTGDAPEPEAVTQRRIMLAVSRDGARMFRNNVGIGWAGDATKIQRDGPAFARRGDVLVRHARPLHAGLCEGSADLIGWKSVEITPEMVGQRFAIFAALEVKSETGRTSGEQANFLRVVDQAGGVAAVVRSVDDAMRALNE